MPRRTTAALTSVLTALGLVVTSATLSVAAPQPTAEPIPVPDHHTGRLLVKFAEDSKAANHPDERAAILRRAVRGSVGTEVDMAALGVSVVEVEGDPAALANALNQRRDIDFVQIEGLTYPASTPPDPLFPDQWGLHSGAGGIGADRALDWASGSGVRVAVVDSGMTDHPDLAGQWIGGYDFVSEVAKSGDGNGRDPDPHDEGDFYGGNNSSWHGTHVAGIVAAKRNKIGITGVAPNAKLVPVRVLGRNGGTVRDVVEGMMWAAGVPIPGVPDNPYPARIINLSIGNKGSSRATCSPFAQQAVDKARSRGALLVVSAGNEAIDASDTPYGSCRGVLTVGASAHDRTKAVFSNFGNHVDVMAPGGDPVIMSTFLNNATTRHNPKYTYRGLWGTSMAAPMVSGVAAMALSVNPNLSEGQLKNLLTSNTNPMRSCLNGKQRVACGTGLVDATKVVIAAAQTVGKTLKPASVAGRPASKPSNVRGDHNGDRYADVIGVDKWGYTHYWASRSNGNRINWIYQGSRGNQFRGMNYIAQVGDLNGDKRTDLIARDRNGNLWAFYSLGQGYFGNPRQIGKRWSQLDLILPAGNLRGGSTQYLLARHRQQGTLWAYRFTPTGLKDGQVVGWKWGNQRTLIGVGDKTNDGIADLLSIDRQGRLWYYAGQRNGRFAEARRSGGGWGSFPNAVSPGDLNGDGRWDMLGRRNDGVLWGYLNYANGGWSEAFVVGQYMTNYRLIA